MIKVQILSVSRLEVTTRKTAQVNGALGTLGAVQVLYGDNAVRASAWFCFVWTQVVQANTSEWGGGGGGGQKRTNITACVIGRFKEQ
jgi:hypothetical protein